MTNNKVYIHEYIDIIGHNRANYMHHMTANFSPMAQVQRHQLCYGVWGTVGTTQSGRGSAAAQVTFSTATAVWGTVNGFFVANSTTNAAGVVYFAANFDDTTAVTVNTNDVIKVTPTWVYTG